MAEMSDDDIKKEFAEAVRILKEDSIISHSRATDERLARIEERLSGKSGDSGDGDKSTEGEPPPKKEPKESTEDAKGKSMWWGDRI